METAWLTAVVSTVVGVVSVGIGAITGRNTRQADVTDKLIEAAASAAIGLTAENARLLRRLTDLQDEVEKLEHRCDRLEAYLRGLGLAVPDDIP